MVPSVIQRASNPHRDAYDWAITLRSNGLLIGWLILGRSRYATEESMHECGCGYALNQHYWGQGYMPEALQAAFTYAFTVLGTRLIHAECERENTALICSRSPGSLSSTGRCFSSACFPSSRCATRGSYSQGNTLKILTPHLQLLTP